MSFETVVRPVVFPNIRPSPAQSQPPADDPTHGICTIKGASGQFLDLQYSWSASSSQSKPQEIKRRFDVARVYQMDDDDIVNYDNFIDIEVANKLWMIDAGQTIENSYIDLESQMQTEFGKVKNIEIKEHNVTRRRSVKGQEIDA